MGQSERQLFKPRTRLVVRIEAPAVGAHLQFLALGVDDHRGEPDRNHLAGLAVDEAFVGFVHGEHHLGSGFEAQHFWREEVLFEELNLAVRSPGVGLADGLRPR